MQRGADGLSDSAGYSFFDSGDVALLGQRKRTPWADVGEYRDCLIQVAAADSRCRQGSAYSRVLSDCFGLHDLCMIYWRRFRLLVYYSVLCIPCCTHSSVRVQSISCAVLIVARARETRYLGPTAIGDYHPLSHRRILYTRVAMISFRTGRPS